MEPTFTKTMQSRQLNTASDNTIHASKSMFVIKLTYWLGIGADALWALGLLIPQVYAVLVGTPDFAPDFQTRQLMLLGGSLMTGWTFLLIWALQKPVERRGVLLLTAFPVIFGLFFTTANGIANGNRVLYWALAKLIVLIIAMVSSYLLAGKLAHQTMTSGTR